MCHVVIVFHTCIAEGVERHDCAGKLSRAQSDVVPSTKGLVGKHGRIYTLDMKIRKSQCFETLPVTSSILQLTIVSIQSHVSSLQRTPTARWRRPATRPQ